MSRTQIFLFCFSLVIIIVCSIGFHSGKFLHFSNGNATGAAVIKPEKAYLSNKKMFRNGFCTNRDISISQSQYSTKGIPQFIVQIVNTCISGCAPSNIHLHCGWFASARMVNPRTFKRLSYDDCLINGGRPLKTSQIISFTYSNTFMYPLAFKSAKFC